MARRIFISHQHEDRMQAKGFNLLQWNPNVDLDFVGRHLLDPVDSSNTEYIKRKIMEQLSGTSVTVVLIGNKTGDSNWVLWEIEQSLSKNNPNGILGILLKGATPPAPDSPVGKALHAAGAEIIEWQPHEFNAAIERAAKATNRIQQIRTSRNRGESGGCGSR